MTDEPDKGSIAVLRRWAVIVAFILSCLGQFIAFLQVRSLTVPVSNRLADEEQSSVTDPVTAYRLPAQEEENARRLYFATTLWFFSGQLYELSLLVLVLNQQWISKMSDRAKALKEKLWGQAWSVVPRAVLLAFLVLLPSQAYAHYFQLKFGWSTTEWPEWSAAQFLGTVAGLVIFPIIIWIFYATVRKSPRRWWLFLSFSAVLLSLGLDYRSSVQNAERYIILSAGHPQLVETIQRLAARDGLQIPEDDILKRFTKNSNLGSLNSHVSGIGPQRRIVISSSAIEKLNADQMSFLASHEIAHYRYNHPLWTVLFSAFLLVPLMYLCYRITNYLQGRWGTSWGIPSLDDLASLPLFLLVFSLVFEVGGVAENIYSWHQETQADQYAMELINGVVADPDQAAAQALQKLGEDSLEYPYPYAFVDVFLSDHPPISARVQFVLRYAPSKVGDKRSL